MAKLSPKAQAAELGKCYSNPAYFIGTHCQIYDAVLADWLPFDLWPMQQDALQIVHSNRLTVILKARQLGATWFCLGYALWAMLFRPAQTVLLFSRRDTEAVYLLGSDRLRGMYKRLPEWLVSGHTVTADSAHEWALSNGSTARAFPSNSGDSYAATLAIVDEADLIPDLGSLLRSVKPTIDAGGKLVLLSRPDKSKPVSPFKRIYTEARAGRNGWKCIFMPWYAHPGRSQEWYEAQKVDILSRTGALDDLAEQYPTTDTEALAPRSLDKRIPSTWLEAVYVEASGTNPLGVPGLTVYVEPQDGREYVIGADPAEGNPNSDDSAATVLDKATGEEVAVLAGKLQPSTFASYVSQLAAWYNKASLMVERNNHGHAVLLWLADNSKATVLKGHDDNVGWLSSSKGKALLYAGATDAIHAKEVTIHSFDTFAQLASIDGSTLRAPEGEHDDRADSFALACAGIHKAAGQVAMRTATVLGRSQRPQFRRGTIRTVSA
jgi:hypothetical protein